MGDLLTTVASSSSCYPEVAAATEVEGMDLPVAVQGGTESWLERLCYFVDGVLIQHNLTARVCGGYVAGNSLLLTFPDATMLKTAVCEDIRQALGAKQVQAAPGALLIQ